MHAKIHTVEELTPSPGKTARVSSRLLAVKARSSTRKNEGIEWWEIKATESRNTGTGERGGAFKAYTAKLTLQLYPEELKAILNAAIANGLVDVPGYQHLLEARSSLENAIAEMKRASSDQTNPR